MSDSEEMSDEELDSLISDLESREGGGDLGDVSAGDGAPEEDLDEFLSQIDEESGGGGGEPATTTVDEPEVDAPDVPDLDQLEGTDDLPAESDGDAAPVETPDGGGDEAGKSAEAAEEAAPKKSSGETGESSALLYAWVAAKWAGLGLPVLAFWWLLGSYLGHWVSAGWLIFVVATATVFVLPKLLYDASGRRGKYRWWLAGTGLVATVGLVAPLTGAAGEALAAYGDWPGIPVAEILGTDLGVGEVFGYLGDLLGGELAPGLPESATDAEIGTTVSE